MSIPLYLIFINFHILPIDLDRKDENYPNLYYFFFSFFQYNCFLFHQLLTVSLGFPIFKIQIVAPFLFFHLTPFLHSAFYHLLLNIVKNVKNYILFSNHSHIFCFLPTRRLEMLKASKTCLKHKILKQKGPEIQFNQNFSNSSIKVCQMPLEKKFYFSHKLRLLC